MTRATVARFAEATADRKEPAADVPPREFPQSSSRSFWRVARFYRAGLTSVYT